MAKQYRSQVRFFGSSFDPETREIDVSLGTGVPVERWDYARREAYIEILSMEPESVDLTRMNAGAPFLRDHNWSVDSVIGVFVPGSVRIAGGELLGRVKLSASERNRDIVTDLVDGILPSTSVGYDYDPDAIVESRDDSGMLTRLLTRWTPLEGSLVGVPADITGGVRSAPAEHVEGLDMEEVDTAVAENGERDLEKKVAERVAAELAAYQTRCDDIRVAGRKLGLDSAEIDSVLAERSLTADVAIRKLIDARAERDARSTVLTRVDITRDEAETRRALTTDWLASRAKVQDVNPDAEREIGNISLELLLREMVPGSRGLSRSALLKRAMTTSDFPLLLENVAHKALIAVNGQMGDYLWYEKVFTRMDYNDFREHSTPWVGHASILPSVLEGAPYTAGSMGEGAEKSTAIKYGKDFQFTLEMLYNDDMDAFAAGPMAIQEAFIRTKSALAAALLTGNQVMSDTKTLFHTEHANLSASGGVPSVTRVNELWNLLFAMLDPDGSTAIGMQGKFLLFPGTLKAGIEQLYVTNRVLPDYTTEALIANIAPENRIAIPGMTGTAYYMATGRRNSARWGYLRDEGGLVISEHEEYNNDSMVWHARGVFGCHINTWGDFAANPGA
jgi:hypothetical protein